MKRYLMLFFFMIIAAFSFGQSDYQDVVYLRNGSIIRGVIIEVVPNKSLTIEAADGNVLICQFDEIEKYTKEPYEGKTGSSKNSTGFQSEYKGIVEMGAQIAIGRYNLHDKLNDKLMLNLINGYQINPYISVGIGTGMRYQSKLEKIFIPVFGDFRIYFLDSKVSPYLSTGLGCSFDVSRSFEAYGMLIYTTVGVCLKVSEKSDLNLGLGYEMQGEGLHSSPYFDVDNGKLNSICIILGVSF